MRQPTLIPLPETSLLTAYEKQGAYTDCYTLDVAGAVSQAQFVAAFYTSRLFKGERLILKWLVAKPSTDAEAVALAAGMRDNFAAWHVEGRSAAQLLMCDYQGRTRSWLMTSPAQSDGRTATRLMFGTAVVPARNRGTAKSAMPLFFRALVVFHRLYAQALLRSAVNRLDSFGYIGDEGGMETTGEIR